MTPNNIGFARRKFLTFFFVFYFFSGIFPFLSFSSEKEENYTPPAVFDSGTPESNNKILVEIFLSVDHKQNIEVIKQEFKVYNITHVKPQFFSLGHPPENIAIGRNVPAEVARAAIRLATSYNNGIKFILPEKRIALNYIAIGTSMFDERIPVPITQTDLSRLMDPSLSTSQFHILYRHLTGEENG